MIETTPNPLLPDENCCQLSCWFDKDQYSDATPQQFNVLLPDRLNSAVAKRKAEFIAGRYCAQQSLRQLSDKTYDIGIGENRAPLWPANYLGSITHAHGFASAIVARRDTVRGLGIDSENLIEAATAKKIQQQILSPDESYENFESLFNAQQDYLSVIFSAKESLYKCLHPIVKKFFGFQSAAITPMPSSQNSSIHEFSFELLEDLGQEFKRGYTGQGRYTLSNDFAHTAIILR